VAKEHTVRDKDDVERLIDRYDVDSATDIRRAHGSRRHRIDETADAGRLDLYAAGAPDQMAADIAALTTARDGLARQRDAVQGLIESAVGLGTGMKDGHGPIARTMSATFRDRADDAVGVVRALTGYRNELDMVMQAIHQTLNSYDQTEVAAARRLTVTEGGNG
jgi:hypothetical protein